LDPQDQEDYDSEEDSREDEQPQVVVLRPGDLSAEEAKTEKLLASKGRYICTSIHTYISL